MPHSLRWSPVLVAGLLTTACSTSGTDHCALTDASCGPPPPTALVISGISPADGARHVDPSVPVIVTFSRSVDPASVTPSNFSVGSALGSLSVNGASATFTPTAPFPLGADYQVRIQGIRATDGGALARPFTAAFTTRIAPICTDCPVTSFTRPDVEPTGAVVETSEGFTVVGSLSLKLSATQHITFLNADLDVRFDAQGRLRSISGRVQIPSPHERITFADPVRADAGLFTGRWLNEHRDLGIRLKDDVDYFVFDVDVQLGMSIATGETGAGATRPVVVRVPRGGRVLMVVDYRDPMYYLYGEHDLIGGAGVGWSLNGRIPFAPELAVDGLGAFDGRTTRTGTFPINKIVRVTGQLVEDRVTEIHLFDPDPFASNLGVEYQAGFNGAASLDLFIKELIGLDIPLASASGGVRGQAGTLTGFNGYAFLRGTTSRDASWWPAFIPVRPVAELDVLARVESNFTARVALAGEIGWDFPAGRQTMRGSFDASNDSLTVQGAIQDGAAVLALRGIITADQTRVFVTPPPALLDGIAADVNRQVLAQIAAAQKAYDDLVQATATYEFELSLRGIRELIPGIITVAKQGIDAGIIAGLKDYEGLFFYNTLLGLVRDAVQPWKDKLDAVAVAVARADNATTRAQLKSALTTLVANRSLSVTVGIPGVVSHTFQRVILTSTQAAQLTAAAGYIDNIQPALDVRIQMQQVYDLIPERVVFEQVRDDLRNGVLIMEAITELGFVVPHTPPTTFNVYAMIGGTRYEVGPIPGLRVAELVAKLTNPMIEALRTN